MKRLVTADLKLGGLYKKITIGYGGEKTEQKVKLVRTPYWLCPNVEGLKLQYLEADNKPIREEHLTELGFRPYEYSGYTETCWLEDFVESYEQFLQRHEPERDIWFLFNAAHSKTR